MVLVGSLLAFVSFAGPLQRGQPLGLLWIVPVFWFCVHMLVINILKVLWNGLSAGWTWTFPGQKGLCRDSSTEALVLFSFALLTHAPYR